MPGTEAAQRKTELPYASDHFIVSDSFDRACMIFAFKTTSDISVQCALRPALISIKTLATAIASRTSDPQVSPHRFAERALCSMRPNSADVVRS